MRDELRAKYEDSFVDIVDIGAESVLEPSFTFSVAGQGPVYISFYKDIGLARIHDVSGSLVQELPVQGKDAGWDGIDRYGHTAKSGLYFVQFLDKNGAVRHCSKAQFLRY